MDISKYITYNEAVKSDAAIRNGIDNTPNEKQLQAMQHVAKYVFNHVREHFDVPIAVTSFFRCEELNKLIGGSSSSQHCKGEAMDIDADIYGKLTNKEIFEWIRDNLDYDQLIWEFGNDQNPDWVHVSLKQGMNRKQTLKAIRKNGMVQYQNYK